MQPRPQPLGPRAADAASLVISAPFAEYTVLLGPGLARISARSRDLAEGPIRRAAGARGGVIF